MRGFEQIPWFYDALMALSDRAGLGRWRRWLVGDIRGRVLEVGCGTGRNLPLYPGTARVVALDPHPHGLATARRRAPGVPLVRASAGALPFKDGSFDTVVSALVLCSVPDPPLALAEVRRILRPAGALRMIEHVRSRGRLGAWLQDVVQPAWTALSGGCHPNRDTEGSVEAAGFRIAAEGRREHGTMRRFEAR